MVQIDEIVTQIYEMLKPIGISVFKYRSPANRRGVFIVVNPLAFVGRIEQSAVINVNLYADNNADGTVNSLKLNEYIGRITEILDSNWKDNQLIEYGSSNYIYEDKQTFINTKINFRKLNYGK